MEVHWQQCMDGICDNAPLPPAGTTITDTTHTQEDLKILTNKIKDLEEVELKRRYKSHYRRAEEDSRETEVEDLLTRLYHLKQFEEDQEDDFEYEDRKNIELSEATLDDVCLPSMVEISAENVFRNEVPKAPPKPKAQAHTGNLKIRRCMRRWVDR